MPVIGPSENPASVEAAYNEVRELLREKYGIQKFATGPDQFPHYPDWTPDRAECNAGLKEAIRLLFQLDSWENW